MHPAISTGLTLDILQPRMAPSQTALFAGGQSLRPAALALPASHSVHALVGYNRVVTLGARLFVIVLATFAAFSIHARFEAETLNAVSSPLAVDVAYVVAHIVASVVLMAGVFVSLALNVDLSGRGDVRQIRQLSPRSSESAQQKTAPSASEAEATSSRRSSGSSTASSHSHSSLGILPDPKLPDVRHRMATRMVGYVNHELRNPLNGVMGLLELAIGSVSACISMAEQQAAQSESTFADQQAATAGATDATPATSVDKSATCDAPSTCPVDIPRGRAAKALSVSTTDGGREGSSPTAMPLTPRSFRPSATLVEKLSLVRSDLVSIDHLCQLLKLVVDDVREIRRFEDGALVITPVPVLLRPIVAEAVAIMQPKLSEKPFVSVGVEFCDKSLETTPVRCDPFRVKQVLLNLLSNSIRYSERGKITISVSRVGQDDDRDVGFLQKNCGGSEHSRGDRIRFKVSDCGFGISAEKQRLLFEPFHPDYERIVMGAGTSVSASASRYGGTGLGLYLCGLLAKLMGGEIDFVSTEGNGSSFWLDIPAVMASPSELPPGPPFTGNGVLYESSSKNPYNKLTPFVPARVSSEGETGSDTASLRRGSANLSESTSPSSSGSESECTSVKTQPPADGMTTAVQTASKLAGNGAALRGTRHLVVDDDRINRTVLRRYLEGAGAAGVDEAENGLEALRLTTSGGGYDYIWIDMKMPIMGGLEATRRIRLLDQRFASIPIIGVTGDVTENDVQICREAGMTTVMSKPISRARVLSMATASATQGGIPVN